MKTLLKLIAGLVVIVVLLVVAAAIIIPRFFDPNDYKDEIAEAVKKETGRDLVIQGDIGLSVFPWLAMDLGAVQLGNAPGFPGETFAQLERMKIGVKLLPLLGKRLEMDTVTVHGLALNLARDKQGRTNWQDLVKEPSAKEPPKEKSTSPAITILGVGGLDIRDARLTWNDAQAGQQYAVKNLSLRTGGLTAGTPVALQLGFDVEGGEPAMSGQVAVETKLAVDMAAQTYRAADLKADVDFTGDAFPEGKLAVSLAGDVAGTQDSVSLKPLTLTLDETMLKGSLEVLNFATQAVRFDLAGDAFDVDRYLPAKETTGAPAGTPGTAAAGAGELPLDALRKLNIDGQFRLGKLKVANINLSDITVTVKGKGGLIQVHPLQARLYDGSYSGNIGLDARGNQLKVTVDEALTGVQAGPLLKDLQGDDIVSGQAQLNLKASARGKTAEGMKKTLSGQTDFMFSNGMVKGIDIVHTVCNATQTVLKLTGASADQGASAGTKFQELAGRMPITNGRASINDTLLLKSPLLRVQGQGGAIDLGANRLDSVSFVVKPSFTCEGQGGKELKELLGSEIPITCDGPMEGRSCRPDSKMLAGLLLGGVGGEKVEAVKEAVEKGLTEKLGGEGGDAVKGLGGALKGILGK